MRTGWTVKLQRAVPKGRLCHPGWPRYVWAFHDRGELGPRMLARIAKHTGLTPQDL